MIDGAFGSCVLGPDVGKFLFVVEKPMNFSAGEQTIDGYHELHDETIYKEDTVSLNGSINGSVKRKVSLRENCQRGNI